MVQNSILITDGTTLTIEPGVEVKFNYTARLLVLGQLTAIGNINDSISFTATDESQGWLGIDFNDTPLTNDSSKFIYCKLQYTKQYDDQTASAFEISHYSKINISNCFISNHISQSPILVLYGDIIIKNNLICNNYSGVGGGINIAYSDAIISGNIITENNADVEAGGISINHGNPIVKNNIISNNYCRFGGGFYITNSQASIYNNIITNNSTIADGENDHNGGGIYTVLGTPNIHNNTISNNKSNYGGAIYFAEMDESYTIQNNIIWGNVATEDGNQIYLDTDALSPNFTYCDIEGGQNDIGIAPGSFFLGEYENNIDENPLFTNPSSGAGNEYDGTSADWSLQNNSPCIDAGNPSGDYPELDLLGNTRIHNGIIDMGAIEHQGVPLEISISAQPTEICASENSQLTTTATGGSENYTYSWTSTPEGFTSDISNPSVSPLITTTYHVEVSDGTSTLQESVTITVNPFPADAVEITGLTEVCQGESEFSYSIETIENATSYSWSLPEGFNMLSGENTNSITVEASETAASGNISVVGVNDCGDGISSSLGISVNLLEISAGEYQNISHTSSTTLNGSVSQGSGDYSWQWQPASLLEDANVQNPVTVILTEDTEFTLEVTDNTTGCTSSDIVNIVVGDALEVEITVNPTTICFGESLIIENTVTGGSGEYYYSWTSNPVGYTSSEATPTISPNETKEYIVEVNDGLTSVTSSITITVIQLVADAGVIIGPQDICLGTSDIEFTVPVIEHADSHQWTLPNGFVITSGENTNTITVSVGNNAENGLITVTGINDCGQGASASLELSIHSISAFAGEDQTIINGTSTQLEGSATEGSGDYSWSWEPTDLLDNPSISNPITTELNSTSTFDLTVTDNTYGCSDTDDVVIFVENGELVVVATASPDEIEDWEDTELLATVTGGTGTYEYNWTTYPVGFQSNLPSFITSPNYTTIYTVEVTDGETSAQSEVTVTVFAAPAFLINLLVLIP
ncbi:right-handed parallel beta-helix repeat-containing protein [Lentimicrobium sp. L6]|uniref:right-handed parallel beta-helix repeat-containing protein n=1 Tax=Lentimicrobium sp. L6 TaxID=2735916 RepID=UPI001557CED6|nr:right-handed parallel beta-helix repeat-containing protein [Lentimicrobium sp. L6]NPD84524.1 right-handed parallel beta-helix repeat-containing protein [Lentimicrobium sp. L6]